MAAEGTRNCWRSVLSAVQREYAFGFMPLGFCARLIVRLLLLVDGITVRASQACMLRRQQVAHFWQHGAVLRVRDEAAALEYQPDAYRMTVQVASHGSTQRLVHTVFGAIGTLLAAFYPAVKAATSCHVLCSHCLLSGVPNGPVTRLPLAGVLEMITQGRTSFTCPPDNGARQAALAHSCEQSCGSMRWCQTCCLRRCRTLTLRSCSWARRWGRARLA